MNPFRTSKKTQEFKGQNPYLTEPTSGVCLQNTYDYSPFGVSLDGRTVEGDFYRRGFNGMEKDDEVSGEGNSYTAEFWQYSPVIARRWNRDPVLKKHESPYACFANNPIWFTDPNGADTLNFNDKGGMSAPKNKNGGIGGKDVFNIINDSGKVVNSKGFQAGTVQYKWRYNKDLKGKKEDINVLQIKGYNNAKDIFEFLSVNTKVEWSFISTKIGSSENGFITTSHDKATETGVIVLLESKLLKQDYKIIFANHNHPGNTSTPSGNGTNPNGFESDGNWGDRGFAKWLNNEYNKKNNQNAIMYNIFLPKIKTYKSYNEN
jgi:RHS repeat-associated protein